jgi:hypothetical protein
LHQRVSEIKTENRGHALMQERDALGKTLH